MWQGPHRLICATYYFCRLRLRRAMPRLRQANAKLIFCITLRETFNSYLFCFLSFWPILESICATRSRQLLKLDLYATGTCPSFIIRLSSTTLPTVQGKSVCNQLPPDSITGGYNDTIGPIQMPKLCCALSNIPPTPFWFSINKPMCVRLGPAQSIARAATDDGGVSMSFQRDSMNRESHRVVLSVEVHLPPLAKPKKTCER